MILAGFCMIGLHQKAYAGVKATLTLSNSTNFAVSKGVISSKPAGQEFFEQVNLQPNQHYSKVLDVMGSLPTAYESWFIISASKGSTASSNYIHCAKQFSGGVGSVVSILRQDGKSCEILPIVN
jgi:hypothetical protein